MVASHALNALGIVHMDRGSDADAAATDAFERALTLGGHDPKLRASIEQNCGIVANIQERLHGRARAGIGARSPRSRPRATIGGARPRITTWA